MMARKWMIEEIGVVGNVGAVFGYEEANKKRKEKKVTA